MKTKLLSLLLLCVALLILVSGIFLIRQQYSSSDAIIKNAIGQMDK